MHLYNKLPTSANSLPLPSTKLATIHLTLSSLFLLKVNTQLAVCVLCVCVCCICVRVYVRARACVCACVCVHVRVCARVSMQVWMLLPKIIFDGLTNSLYNDTSWIQDLEASDG